MGRQGHRLRFDVETRNVATSRPSRIALMALRFDVETRNVATQAIYECEHCGLRFDVETRNVATLLCILPYRLGCGLM